MTAAISRSVELPPLLAYPERRRPVQGPLERAGIAVAAALRAQSTRGRASRLAPILAATERYAETVDGMSDAALRSAAREAGAALRVDVGQAADTVARVLAPVCEAAFRVLGQRPYPSQVLAAYACTRGMMVELLTGEGKTLSQPAWPPPRSLWPALRCIC